MQKLQIQRISAYNPYWYSIRFTGDTIPFKAMVSLLKQYGVRNAYWRDTEFNGHGGWIVRTDILEKHSERFDNFESRTRIARETYERKQA